MIKKDLLELGFEEVIVQPEESGCNFIFSYFIKNISGITLISSEFDYIDNNNIDVFIFNVYIFNTGDKIIFKDKNELSLFIDILVRNIN